MMKNKYPKRFIVSEIGSLTITEAEEAGGDGSYVMHFPFHYDPEKQARMIDRQLKLIYQTGTDVFIFAWVEPATGQEYDKNKLGFGIWDHVKKEPKPSFWVVYKYFKDFKE